LRKFISILFQLLFLVIGTSLHSLKTPYQDNCKVLSLYLSEKYEGECKKGLAHGSGKAWGEDYYEGEFKKGLPNGKGNYTWSNGTIYNGDWAKGHKHGFGTFIGKDSITVGYWLRDQYVGIEKKPSYKVISNRNADSFSFSKRGDDNFLKIQFMRLGRKNFDLRDLTVDVTSGNLNTSSGEAIIEGIEFPFTCTVRFTTVRKIPTGGDIDILFGFTINEPGAWYVRLNH